PIKAKLEDTLLKSEKLFRKRDVKYYNSVKSVVGSMPDLRGFRHEMVKGAVSNWDDEHRWRLLLDDFELLDSQGTESDRHFIQLINALDTPIRKTRRVEPYPDDRTKELPKVK